MLTKSFTANLNVIECIQMADIEDDTVPLGDGPLVQYGGSLENREKNLCDLRRASVSSARKLRTSRFRERPFAYLPVV